jgi:hypothetical protein
MRSEPNTGRRATSRQGKRLNYTREDDSPVPRSTHANTQSVSFGGMNTAFSVTVPAKRFGVIGLHRRQEGCVQRPQFLRSWQSFLFADPRHTVSGKRINCGSEGPNGKTASTIAREQMKGRGDQRALYSREKRPRLATRPRAKGGA